MFNNIKNSSNFTFKYIICRLNHILEQNHQKRQIIQNFKFFLFLLILSIFQNRKKLNIELPFMKIQYNLIFKNKSYQQK